MFLKGHFSINDSFTAVPSSVYGADWGMNCARPGVKSSFSLIRIQLNSLKVTPLTNPAGKITIHGF